MAVIEEIESQEVAFTLILYSGNARNLIHEAMACMREKNFEDANAKFKEADDELVKAHQAQTTLLQRCSQGDQLEIQIIMVHAQDHLMTTMTLFEIAKEMEYLYRNI